MYIAAAWERKLETEPRRRGEKKKKTATCRLVVLWE